MRLATALRGDLRLQWRFGLVGVGIAVTLMAVGLLSQIDVEPFGFAIPTFVFGNLTMTAFFFVAALVLFERGEGSLEALVVTPLRIGEYLASKVATLTLLASVETVAIVSIAYPGPLALGPLVSGTLAMSAAYVLFGFAMVARYDSITDFLFPAVLAISVCQLPVLASLGIVDGALLYLHPGRALLVWVEASLHPISMGAWIYALGYSGLTLALLYRAAHRAFDAFCRPGSR